MAETTVAATIAIDMLRYLERRGHDVGDLCREAGIDGAIVARPHDRVPDSQMAALWELAVTRTNDPYVSVRMAEEHSPAALDIIGYIVLTCRTVGDTLSSLVRYAGVLNDSLQVALVHDGPHAIVRLDFVDGLRRPVRYTHHRHIVDSMWVGIARQLRSMSTEPIVPLAVRVRHKASDEGLYRRALGAPIAFGAPEDLLILASTDLAKPIPSSNPALFVAFERHADAVLSSLQSHGSLTRRVSEVVAQRLKGRVPPIGEVASELAMSARNLQRALQAEDRTYRQVLDEVRSGLAREYLADDANSVGQVAFLLGFSEAAAFHRAFRKWTGTTPAAARASRGR